MFTMRVPTIVAGGVLTLSTFLAGCGGGTTPPSDVGGTASVAAPSSPPPIGIVSAEHNDADITFAQRMIPHHQQAAEMAETALDQAQRVEVRSLAEQILAAQGPEVTTLIDSLTIWGAEVPAPGSISGGMTGMDHSSMRGMNGADMPGMMTDAQMQELRDATGTMFDTMFLQMMIQHHRGAVSDAQQEVGNGSNPQTKQLAAKMVAEQNAEIDRLQKLLG